MHTYRHKPIVDTRHIETPGEIRRRIEGAEYVRDTRAGLALARLAARRTIEPAEIVALDDAARAAREKLVYGSAGQQEDILPRGAADVQATWDAAPDRTVDEHREPDWREKQLPNGDRD
ncbi:MAG TPA: hypothetical protein VLF59_05855 [Candidatus Saccharimonadales bacterium]|nr:hypothetical protein [Candidatus Saccharimonadales bacterium]